MTRRKLLMKALCACLFILIFFPPGFSRAALKDPGLSEEEIKARWLGFQNKASSVQIKGKYPHMKCFEEAARKHSVPLALLIAMARGESNFNEKSISAKSCYGIMQIQWPDTAKDLGFKKKAELLDACRNIDAGAHYLSWLLKRYDGDLYLAVAAYNYGPNAVAPGAVPRGAQWYAAYIHDRHLRFVMAEHYKRTGQMLVLQFTFYKNAVETMAYMENRAPGVPFEIFKSNKYTFDIYFTYNDGKERDATMALLKNMGIKPMGGGGS